MSSLSFGVKLAGVIGFKMIVFLGGALISLAFLALSFITNLGGFIAIYCIFIGIPSGLVYMLTMVLSSILFGMLMEVLFMNKFFQAGLND